MNETTDKLIRDLAEKLGTTTEHLWSVLVQQAPISAICDALCCALLVAASAALWAAAVNRFRVANAASSFSDTEEFNFGCGVLLALGASIFTFCAIGSVCSSLDLIMAGFFNPEFWALKQILK